MLWCAMLCKSTFVNDVQINILIKYFYRSTAFIQQNAMKVTSMVHIYVCYTSIFVQVIIKAFKHDVKYLLYKEQ